MKLKYDCISQFIYTKGKQFIIFSQLVSKAE